MAHSRWLGQPPTSPCSPRMRTRTGHRHKSQLPVAVY
jgi:hypothetical protein